MALLGKPDLNTPETGFLISAPSRYLSLLSDDPIIERSGLTGNPSETRGNPGQRTILADIDDRRDPTNGKVTLIDRRLPVLQRDDSERPVPAILTCEWLPRMTVVCHLLLKFRMCERQLRVDSCRSANRNAVRSVFPAYDR